MSGSVWPTKHCVVIKNQIYEHDMRPLDPELKTKVSQYSRSYIRHLFKAEEILGMRLVSYQNLAYLKHLMAEMRQAILEDRLLDFKEEMKKKTNYFKSR